MERLLFRKIPVWVLLPLFILIVVGLVGFGIVVRTRALGYDRFGAVGDVAYNVADLPNVIEKIMNPEDRMVAQMWGNVRFKNRAGWSGAATSGQAGVEGYLLLSRYDGDRRRHVVDLVDLSTQETRFTWDPDPNEMFEGVNWSAKYQNVPFSNEHYRHIHPYMTDNGDLIVKDIATPLVRLNACGNTVWRNDALFHHSTEMGPDGNFWIPETYDPVRFNGAPNDYRDDAITQVSPDGEILFTKSVSQILVDNGLQYLLFGVNAGYNDDPIHLNDIQPVMSDGPYWKQGDVFLSIRHKSTIVLYRPSTDKVIWLKTGPWSFQHDVDIIDDTHIGIFNNNMYSKPAGPSVEPGSEVMIYDFATDTVSKPLSDAFRREEFATLAEGLFTILPSGQMLVEEAEFGRVLIFDADGRVALEYVNGAKDGLPYLLGWVRYVPKAQGDAALKELRSANCDN